MNNGIEKNWQYYNPVDVCFGQNAFEVLSSSDLSGNVLLVTTQGSTKRGVTEKIISSIEKAAVTIYDKVDPNPTIDNLDNAWKELSAGTFNTIIASGGGSVIDTAKVLSAVLLSEHECPLDKIFRKEQKIDLNKSIPLIAIPTTAGTGAECTPFATVWDPKNNMKYSLNKKILFPDRAILDHRLTLTLPFNETLFSGLDVISHAMESLWNKNTNLISSKFSTASLNLSLQAFPGLLKDLKNEKYRAMMMQASYLSGLAISQTKTAIAHSISYPLTYTANVPHGLACSFTLSAITDFLETKNIMAPDNLKTIKDISRMLDDLSLKSYLDKFISRTEVVSLIDKMYNPSRMDNFIAPIERNEIEQILKESVVK